MQQIVRAFGRVESSLQYLVNSWTIVVKLISVYKRLRQFESQIGSEHDVGEMDPPSRHDPSIVQS